MKTLGIDPGTKKVGWAFMEDEKLKDFGVIKLKERAPIDDRLFSIFLEILRIIGLYKPEAIAFESVYYAPGRSNFNSVRALIEGRTIVRLVASLTRLPAHEVSSQNAKEAVTGKRNAKKEEVRSMVMTLFRPKNPLEEDSADAAAIAYALSKELKFFGILKEIK